MTSTLPQDYVCRAPTAGDVDAIIALMAALDIAESGTADAYTPEDILSDWRDLDVSTDAWVVASATGEIVGYAAVTDHGSGSIVADAYVHPEQRGRGIGTALVRLTEARARELAAASPGGVRVALSTGVIASDDAARRLLEQEGYTPARAFWRMRIEMASAPPAPIWPAGIAVRAFAPGADEHGAFEAVEEAFQDHWGHVPRTFDDWLEQTRRADFDPALWFLACDGERIAGTALCWRRPDGGWVNNLAVRRPWRRAGLGLALLLHAFGAFYDRGERSVGLGVDAQSLTGATRLYERAGMHITMRIATYEKELCPGADQSVRALRG